MSTYLNFYLKDRRSGKMKLLFYKSGSSDLYQKMHDSLNIPFNYDSNKPKYQELTRQDLSSVLENVKEEKKRALQRLDEMEKYMWNFQMASDYIRKKLLGDKEKTDSSSFDLVDEAISEKLDSREYIDDLIRVESKLELIGDMLDSCHIDGSPFSGIFINYD